LPIIGPWHSTMTATLLAIRIKIADFDAFASSFLPFNINIAFVHAYLFSQLRDHSVRGAFWPESSAVNGCVPGLARLLNGAV
jgi:hypothetical protein